jgi:DUF4097 and DUF4098 domain-containing protein YvlB
MMKRMVGILFVIGLAWLALGAGSNVPGQEYKFAPGQKLVIDLKTGGSVTITGGDKAVARVGVSARGEGDATGAIQVESTGGGLTITSVDSPERQEWHNLALTIQVPRACDVQFSSMGGSLKLVDLRGNFSGKTMGGELTLEKVQGKVSLTTMGGDITATDCDLDGKLSTMGGEADLRNVTGDVEASSMGGIVRYVNVRDRSGNLRAQSSLTVHGMTEKTVLMSTMGGDINLKSAPDGASVKTMGGEIDIRDAEQFVKATTMGGDIRVDVRNGWVDLTTMAGNIETTVRESLGDTADGIKLESMSGDITVIVPAGLSLSFDLTIAYTRNSDQNYKISSDFGLNEERSADWDYEHGSPRKTIHATGSVGGGHYPIKIKTINGNITVRQAR